MATGTCLWLLRSQGPSKQLPGFPWLFPLFPWLTTQLAKEGQKADWAAWPWHPSCSALHIKVPSSLTNTASPHTTTTTIKNEACWGSLCWLHTSLITPKDFLECLTRVWVVGRQRREVVPATAQRGSGKLAAPRWFNGALGLRASDLGPGPTPTVPSSYSPLGMQAPERAWQASCSTIN